MAIFDAQQLSALNDFYSDLIVSFGKACKLIYHGKFVTGNQNLTLADNTYLKNIGIHGGPINSEDVIQGGSGLIQNSVSENITLVIDWSINDAKKYGINITSPYAIIKTHGHLTDLSKILKAVEMQVDLPLSPIVVGKYRFLGQGTDVFSIVQGKYFIGFWERIS